MDKKHLSSTKNLIKIHNLPINQGIKSESIAWLLFIIIILLIYHDFEFRNALISS